jgi:tetratricopeptide (TPR) repeat protein
LSHLLAPVPPLRLFSLLFCLSVLPVSGALASETVRLPAATPTPPTASPTASPTAQSAGTAPASEPAARLLSDADLDKLEAQMEGPSQEQRLAAARIVEQADHEGFRTYAARLGRPVKSPPTLLKRLIHAIWGQYPNPDYPRGPGKDPPMWLVRPEPPPPPPPPGTPRSKRQKPGKPHDPEAADWLRSLALLDLAHDPFVADLPAGELRAARAELLMRVALLHALGSAGKQGDREAVSAVFQFAFVTEGLFRDECGRTIRGMGGHAVPTLIRIYNDRTRANAKMRRYASYQLDRMDRLRPAKAISAAPDDVVRADILRAYGEVMALDAVEAVLDQVGSPSHRVRREARWAWLRYVDGPPPPPAPKRKRKLPGGREEAEEKEDYLNYREMAVLVLGRTYQQLFSREPQKDAGPRALTDEIFAYYDHQREKQFEQVFSEAQAFEKQGQLDKAVDAFGWILANQPDHPRRAEMAAVFAKLGESLASEAEKKRDEAGRARALGLLRQALLLYPGESAAASGEAHAAEEARICALVHRLDAEQARRLGGDGRLDEAQAKECGRSAPPRDAARDVGKAGDPGTLGLSAVSQAGPDARGRLRLGLGARLSGRRSAGGLPGEPRSDRIYTAAPWLLLAAGLILFGLALALHRARRRTVNA